MKYHTPAISLTILILTLCFSGYAPAKDISFSSEEDASGDTLTVSINVDDLSGIAGGDITFSYDTTVLTALYSSVGADAPSGLFIGNVLDPDGPGTVSLTMAGATALTRTGPGELATVTFNILNSAYQDRAMTVTVMSLKDESGDEIAETTLGMDSGGSSGSGGGGGGGGCFINTFLSNYNAPVSITFAIILTILLALSIGSALLIRMKKASRIIRGN